MTLVFSKRAAKDLDAILTFLGTRSEPGMVRVSHRIHELLALLPQQPGLGPETGYRETRRIVVTPYPYVIYYRVQDDTVLIQRIRHSARRPLKWPS